MPSFTLDAGQRVSFPKMVVPPDEMVSIQLADKDGQRSLWHTGSADGTLEPGPGTYEYESDADLGEPLVTAIPVVAPDPIVVEQATAKDLLVSKAVDSFTDLSAIHKQLADLAPSLAAINKQTTFPNNAARDAAIHALTDAVIAIGTAVDNEANALLFIVRQLAAQNGVKVTP